MMKANVSEGLAPIKKYLVKRKQLQEESHTVNSSIFRDSPDSREIVDRGDDPFRKYLQNSSTVQSCAQGGEERRLNSCREDNADGLPAISLGVKVPPRGATLPVDTQNSFSPFRLRRKELTHHVSDPIYMRLQKTICRRVNRKHQKYRREWLDSSSHRKGKDLLSRSFQKAAENIKHINIDVARRKNTFKLEEMLRDNALEKTYVCPGSFNPQISGLRGKGGRVVPLFQEVQMFQEVLKTHQSRQ